MDEEKILIASKKQIFRFELELAEEKKKNRIQIYHKMAEKRHPLHRNPRPRDCDRVLRSKRNLQLVERNEHVNNVKEETSLQVRLYLPQEVTERQPATYSPERR